MLTEGSLGPAEREVHEDRRESSDSYERMTSEEYGQ
jgi:hypothetical protein